MKFNVECLYWVKCVWTVLSEGRTVPTVAAALIWPLLSLSGPGSIIMKHVAILGDPDEYFNEASR